MVMKPKARACKNSKKLPNFTKVSRRLRQNDENGTIEHIQGGSKHIIVNTRRYPNEKSSEANLGVWRSSHRDSRREDRDAEEADDEMESRSIEGEADRFRSCRE